MPDDTAVGLDQAYIKAELDHMEKGTWKCEWVCDKWDNEADFLAGKPADRRDVVPDNILVTGGVSALLHRLLGGTAVTAFDNTNAAIGVGDSTAAASTEQTDLQATTNKFRKAMDAGYPQHTDTAATIGSKTCLWRSTFASGDANFVWSEWGIFNSATLGSGRMLNRRQASLGTKATGAVWQLSVQVTIA